MDVFFVKDILQVIAKKVCRIFENLTSQKLN